MMRLAELIAQFEPELLARHGHHLLPSHRQALAALKACRTRFAPHMLAGNRCMLPILGRPPLPVTARSHRSIYSGATPHFFPPEPGLSNKRIRSRLRAIYPYSLCVRFCEGADGNKVSVSKRSVAVAAKNARMCWAVLQRGEAFKMPT